MANLSSQDDFIRTALRLPRDLHARIQLAAENEGRSMNAELIHRLEMSFETSQVVEIRVLADGSVTLDQVKQAVQKAKPLIGETDTVVLSVKSG